MQTMISDDDVSRCFGTVQWGESKTRAYAQGDRNQNQVVVEQSVREA